MTLKQVVGAYRRIGELTELVFPYGTTRELLGLKKRIEEEFDTILTMEKALVAKYGGVAGKGGACKFPDAEKGRQFAAERDKLMNQEQKIRLPTVDLSKFTSSIRISPAAIEALEGIVIFEHECPADTKEDNDG